MQFDSLESLIPVLPTLTPPADINRSHYYICIRKGSSYYRYSMFLASTLGHRTNSRVYCGSVPLWRVLLEVYTSPTGYSWYYLLGRSGDPASPS